MPENYYSMFAAPLSNNRDLSVKSLPEKGHSTDKHNPLHQPGMNPEIPMPVAAKAMLQVRRNCRRCVCKKRKRRA